MLNRRNFIGTSTLAGAGALVLSQTSCKPKNLSAWILTITTAFGEIKPLLSQLGLSETVITKVSGWIDEGVRLAKLFDEAYKAGKFTDALTLFNSLGDIIAQVAAELGATDNRIVKLALVSISIARIALAAILQAQESSAPEAIRIAKSSKAGAKAANEVQRLNSINVDKLLKAAQ